MLNYILATAFILLYFMDLQVNVYVLWEINELLCKMQKEKEILSKTYFNP